MGVTRRRDGETGNGDEERGELEERERTRKLLLDRTEISSVRSVDQLCLVGCEDFIANGEQRHSTRISELCHTKHEIQQVVQPRPKERKRTLTIPPTKRLPVTSHHILHHRVLDTRIIATETQHLLFHDERLDVGHAEDGVEADERVEGFEEDGLGEWSG